MQTFLGIAVDAGASIDGDCPMTHTVSPNCVEIEFGQAIGSLYLGLTEAGLTKLLNIATVALDELRALRTNQPDRPRESA